MQTFGSNVTVISGVSYTCTRLDMCCELKEDRQAAQPVVQAS
jgi:hypothetical protein